MGTFNASLRAIGDVKSLPATVEFTFAPGKVLQGNITYIYPYVAGETRTVKLSKPLPVLLTYFTAGVDRDGTLQLRRDVYGRDEKVWQGIEAEFQGRR